MRHFNFKSIQSGIFFYISFIVGCVVLGVIMLYLFTTASNLRKNYVVTSNQMAKIVSSRMDDVVRKVDTLEIHILESDRVRDYVFSDFSNSTADRTITKQWKFEEDIFASAGYDYPFYHLSILKLDGTVLNFGRIFNFETNSKTPEQVAELTEQTVQQRGRKLVSGLNIPKVYAEDNAVAVSRAFSRYPLNEPRAVIEMQIAYTTIEKNINNAILSYENKASQTVIYNKDGQLVYPQDLDSAPLSHYTTAATDIRVVNPVTDEPELISKYYSEYTGWTVALVTPYSLSTYGMSSYITGATIVATIALSVAFLLAMPVAKSISTPIIAIKESLLSLELDTIHNRSGRGIRTSFSELELLHNSVEEMRSKLERSLEGYVRMRSLTIQARLLSLQSQMNPHFLYNTLAIMAILAEENNDPEVSLMCHKLVAMLRYTSAEKESAQLRQEVEQAQLYDELIKIRFGDKIKIEYDIDPALLNAVMPPILLQPMIENSVKYARKGNTRLEIKVRAYCKDERWYIEVQDNGQGFTDEALEELWRKIAQDGDWDKILQHEIEGVGLANIYLRLHLFYEGDFEFDIKNYANGATITVGGKLRGV